MRCAVAPAGRSLRPGPLQPIVRPVGGSCSSPLRCDLRLHVGVGGRELTVGQVQTGYELGEPFIEVDNWVNSCSERVVSTALSFLKFRGGCDRDSFRSRCRVHPDPQDDVDDQQCQGYQREDGNRDLPASEIHRVLP